MKDELFDMVDEYDNVIGKAARKEVHTKSIYHYCNNFIVTQPKDL